VRRTVTVSATAPTRMIRSLLPVYAALLNQGRLEELQQQDKIQKYFAVTGNI